MIVVGGIDEAGYGPLLGPLIVSGAGFEITNPQQGDSLWKLLSGSISTARSKRDRRLPIIDSKRLYVRKQGLAALERSALVMLHVAGVRPTSFRGLLTAVCPHVLGELDDYPWYRDYDPPLPVSVTPADVATRANAVARDCKANGVCVSGIYVEPLLEGRFNRLVSNTRNKAVVSLGLTLRIVQRILDQAADHPVRLCIDRQGGRQHYTQALMTAFQGFDLRIVEESPERSAYRLTRDQRARSTRQSSGAAPDADRSLGCQIEFVTSGEEAAMPTALASIISKYLRELFMQAVNDFWCARVPNLRPTAGYYQDGRRFLNDITGAVDQAGVDRAILVRSR
ncbi:MAG: hypothetical protein IID37_08700 [Planctomycetes bacterium]|nr:hypothetical protein [Planctomycetota bacterium]